MSVKDLEQDQLIRENSARIKRNEDALKRQTEALEKIRDHYYPPPKGLLKRICGWFLKSICFVVAYLSVTETVGWLWEMRESNALAEHYAKVAQRLFSSEGNAHGAISCYEKAVKLNPRDSDYLIALVFMKGLAMSADFLASERPLTDAEQARVDVALAEAFALQELQPDDPMPYVLMAQAYLLSGEKTDAVAAVEKAVAHGSNRANVRVSACAIHFFAGHFAEARAHLTEAERLDAAMPLVHVWKGLLARAIDHDNAAARSHFETTIRLAPRLPLAHTQLGHLFLTDSPPDLKAARAAFAQSLVLDAKQTMAMLWMAETYEREDNLVLAKLWLDRLLVIDKHCLPALLARARVNGGLNKFDLSIQDLSAAIALASFRSDLYRLRADAYDKAGMKAQADSDRTTAAALEASK